MSMPPTPGPSLQGAVDLSALVRRASAPPPAAGAAAPAEADAVVFEADDANFQRVLELSSTVPVIVEIVASGIQPALGDLVRSYGGRMALAIVDGQGSPQLAQAFQVREVPAVAAVIGGRPLSLFVGMPAPAEVRQVLDQVLQLAAQEGVTGSIPVGDQQPQPEAGEEPAEPPLPPLHQQAYDAAAAGDFAGAEAAFRQALAENPRDADAKAGLAQMALLVRLDGVDPATVRAAAADRPDDVDAALAVADLDVSGGHVEDGFGRLLDVFAGADAEGRTRLRERLLDLFETVGSDDPRVIAARRRLSTLLF